MPAIAAITLLNGEATPVSHTFNPMGRDAKTGVWTFEDSSPRAGYTSSLGYPRIGISTRRGNRVSMGEVADNLVNRVKITIAIPQLETIGTSLSGYTAPPKVGYVDRCNIEFMLPARDVLADRKDIKAYASNILANASVIDLVHNLSSFWS